MNENQIELLNALIETGKAKGFVSVKEILAFVDEDSEEFDDVISKLDDEGITITGTSTNDEFKDEVDIESLAFEELDEFIMEKELESPEIDDIASEYENDLKNKDIDRNARVLYNYRVYQKFGFLWR